MTKTVLATAAAATLFAAFAFSQGSGGLNFSVAETAGIRRSAYPVNARIPLQKGALKDPNQVRLLLNDKETAAQCSAESRWPDNSIEWLDVDFNATIGPLEQQTYRIEYGDDVKPAPRPRGLTVTDSADSVQVGSVRFNKNASSPLVLSVSYRQEDIGRGANGFTVTDDKGAERELNAADVRVEAVKNGPLYVVVRYSGKAQIDAGYSVPFVITAETPNSKTWVKYSASVDDPARRLRAISFNSPIAFGATPWLWDFGTGSWSYGSFRNPTDSVVFMQTVGASGNGWQIKNGAKGQEQLYETAAGARPKIGEGWGHFQDGKEVIAFGFDKFGQTPGTYTVAFDGQGQETFRFSPAQPATQHRIAIYQHYVASPAPIGAVTSPISMLNSLVVTVKPQ